MSTITSSRGIIENIEGGFNSQFLWGGGSSKKMTTIRGGGGLCEKIGKLRLVMLFLTGASQIPTSPPSLIKNERSLNTNSDSVHDMFMTF